MEPHICVVANRTDDSRVDLDDIANADAQPVALTGLELTDYTGTQRRPHIYHFPRTTKNETLYLDPHKSAYVFTGTGKNSRSETGNFLLFWNLAISVWNNDGDVAYLRQGNGTFVSTMTVGDPKRHPNGH